MTIVQFLYKRIFLKRGMEISRWVEKLYLVNDLLPLREKVLEGQMRV